MPWNRPTPRSLGAEAAADVLATVSRDRHMAAQKTLAYFEAGKAAEPLLNAARQAMVLKGEDAHDYKFGAAVLEDTGAVSPAWRGRFLAACMMQLNGSGERDSPLVARSRAALARVPLPQCKLPVAGNASPFPHAATWPRQTHPGRHNSNSAQQNMTQLKMTRPNTQPRCLERIFNNRTVADTDSLLFRTPFCHQPPFSLPPASEAPEKRQLVVRVRWLTSRISAKRPLMAFLSASTNRFDPLPHHQLLLGPSGLAVPGDRGSEDGRLY